MSTRRPGLWVCVTVGLTVLTSVHADDEVGRLFFSPAERGALERARSGEPPADPAANDSSTDVITLIIPDEAQTFTPKPTLRVDGIVTRSRGPGTYWLNGASSSDGDLGSSGIDRKRSAIANGRVRLQSLDSTPPVNLKPGQSFDPNAQTVHDLYESPPNDLFVVEP